MTQLGDILLPPGGFRADREGGREDPSILPTRVTTRTLLLAALVVVAATVAAYIWSALQARLYAAEAAVIVNTKGYDSESETARALATQRLIARSDAILRPVAHASNLRVKDLREALSVEMVGETEVLRFRVAQRDGAKAGELTQAVAESYVASVSGEGDVRDKTADELTARIDALSSSLAEIRAEQDQEVARRAASGRAALPTVEERRLEIQASNLAARIAPLQERLLTLDARKSPPEVRILTPARILEDPVEPKPRQAAAGGFVVGSLLATGLCAAQATGLIRQRPLKRQRRSWRKLAKPRSAF